MELKDQVCALEYSKKLKELGVPQESLFWWQATYTHPLGYECEDCSKFKRADGNFEPHPCGYHVAFYEDGKGFDISAFTIAELGEMLPGMLKHQYVPDAEMYWLDCEKSGSDWRIVYRKLGTFDYFQILTGAHETSILEAVTDTEANARAKMLIYLLEQKLITL